MKDLIQVLTRQAELNNQMKAAMDTILNNTICIYQKLEQMDPDLSSSSAASKTKKRKAYN